MTKFFQIYFLDNKRVKLIGFTDKIKQKKKIEKFAHFIFWGIKIKIYRNMSKNKVKEFQTMNEKKNCYKN